MKVNQLRVAQNRYEKLIQVSNSRRTRLLSSFNKHITINHTWIDTIKVVMGLPLKVCLSIAQHYTLPASTTTKVSWVERVPRRIPTPENKIASRVASLRAQAVFSTEWITFWCLTPSLLLTRAVCTSITISSGRVNSCTLMKAHIKPKAVINN